MLFTQLPEDVLYHILFHLDHKSLSRLSQVCKSMNRFVNRDVVWRTIAKGCLNTGITWNGTDIYPNIPLKERVRTAQNWYNGVCKRWILLKWKTKLLPWLQLDGDVLYLSQAAKIGAYPLHHDSRRLQRNPLENFSGHTGDICRFIVTDSHLISAGSDGRIVVHSRRSEMSLGLTGHSQEVNCLDSKNGLIISGSRDRTARMWTLTSRSPLATIPMFDRVWSVAISPTQRFALLPHGGRASVMSIGRKFFGLMRPNQSFLAIRQDEVSQLLFPEAVSGCHYNDEWTPPPVGISLEDLTPDDFGPFPIHKVTFLFAVVCYSLFQVFKLGHL